jgi:hypothetical protein
MLQQATGASGNGIETSGFRPYRWHRNGPLQDFSVLNYLAVTPAIFAMAPAMPEVFYTAIPDATP